MLFFLDGPSESGVDGGVERRLIRSQTQERGPPLAPGEFQYCTFWNGETSLERGRQSNHHRHLKNKRFYCRFLILRHMGDGGRGSGDPYQKQLPR